MFEVRNGAIASFGTKTPVHTGVGVLEFGVLEGEEAMMDMGEMEDVGEATVEDAAGEMGVINVVSKTLKNCPYH